MKKLLSLRDNAYLITAHALMSQHLIDIPPGVASTYSLLHKPGLLSSEVEENTGKLPRREQHKSVILFKRVIVAQKSHPSPGTMV